MKKVIFICLLSLSLCLSKPADDQAKPVQQQNAPVIDPKIQSPTETSTETKAATTEQKVSTKTDNVKHPEATIGTSETKVNPAQPTTDENKTKKDAEPPKEEAKKVDPPKEEAKKADPPKEEAKKVEPAKEDSKKVEPSKDAQGSTDAKTNTDNKETVTTTKPEEKTEKGPVTTTEKANVTAKPTEAPKKEDDKPVLQARGFDGPSFIGGIILTLGLLAISFMGFKYYKNQTERNYHTL